VSLLILPIISATATSFLFKQNTLVNLKVPVYTTTNAQASNSVDCYLTIRNPNESILINNQEMTWNTGGIYNYTIAGFSYLGYHPASVSCGDGTDNGFSSFVIEITSNGKEPPDGIVITLFIIFFIFLLLFTTYIIIYSIGHAVKLDFDVIDLAWNYGVFFVLVGMKIAEEAYLGNVAIENYLGWTINIGIWVLMILPTIYFILTLTIGTILSKRIKGVDY
jgi:hypothetical protein